MFLNIGKTMNAQLLFDTIHSKFGKLEQVQVDGVNAILDACTKHGITDKNQIAYVIATAWHEARFKPVCEVGKGALKSYGKPDPVTHQIYYGRGFCQITFKANYAEFGRLLNIDLVNKPDLALQPQYAAEIIAIGMKGGLFTGVGLSHYFNDKINDPINARRIINGQDCAELIAGYYNYILPGIEN